MTVLITLNSNGKGVNIFFNGWRAPCHIGHGGLTNNKKEVAGIVVQLAAIIIFTQCAITFEHCISQNG